MQPASWWRLDSASWSQFCGVLATLGERPLELRATRVLEGFSNSNWHLSGAKGQYFLQFLSQKADHIRSPITPPQLQAIHSQPGLTSNLPPLLWCNEKIRLFRWINGRHLQASELLTGAAPRLLVEFIGRLHISELQLPEIDLRQQLARYQKYQRDSALGVELQRAQHLMTEFRPSVCAHNDLSPQNVLWDGKNIAVVDWEYAGRSDPAFEWAALFQQFAVIPSRQKEWLTQYRQLTGIAIENEHLARMTQLYQSLSRLWFAHMAVEYG